MAETTNYGLYLEDDSSAKFKEWREKINSSANSNMIKIDTALSGKADKSIFVPSVLTASAWVGVDNPFTQVIAVRGLTANHNGSIHVAQEATFEQRNAARLAMLCVTGQTDGYLTISADGEMPDIDIPVTVVLMD